MWKADTSVVEYTEDQIGCISVIITVQFTIISSSKLISSHIVLGRRLVFIVPSS